MPKMGMQGFPPTVGVTNNPPTAKRALMEFADFLDRHRPTPEQLKISSEYNAAAAGALDWAASEARKRAKELP